MSDASNVIPREHAITTYLKWQQRHFAAIFSWDLGRHASRPVKPSEYRRSRGESTTCDMSALTVPRRSIRGPPKGFEPRLDRIESERLKAGRGVCTRLLGTRVELNRERPHQPSPGASLHTVNRVLQRPAGPRLHPGVAVLSGRALHRDPDSWQPAR